jgi:transcription antitermination factor NusG
VKITEAEHFAVLNTPGAVCYVSFDGQAVSIPDEQINYLSRFIINNNQDIEVHYCSFEEGDLVEVSAGPLQGIKGEIIEVRGKQRLLLRFSSLGCCIHAEVSSGELSREQRISAVRSAKSETTMS